MARNPRAALQVLRFGARHIHSSTAASERVLYKKVEDTTGRIEAILKKEFDRYVKPVTQFSLPKDQVFQENIITQLIAEIEAGNQDARKMLEGILEYQKGEIDLIIFNRKRAAAVKASNDEFFEVVGDLIKGVSWFGKALLGAVGYGVNKLATDVKSTDHKTPEQAAHRDGSFDKVTNEMRVTANCLLVASEDEKSRGTVYTRFIDNEDILVHLTEEEIAILRQEIFVNPYLPASRGEDEADGSTNINQPIIAGNMVLGSSQYFIVSRDYLKDMTEGQQHKVRSALSKLDAAIRKAEIKSGFKVLLSENTTAVFNNNGRVLHRRDIDFSQRLLTEEKTARTVVGVVSGEEHWQLSHGIKATAVEKFQKIAKENDKESRA